MSKSTPPSCRGFNQSFKPFVSTSYNTPWQSLRPPTSKSTPPSCRGWVNFDFLHQSFLTQCLLKWLQPKLQPLHFNVLQHPPVVVTVANVEIDPAKLPRVGKFRLSALIISHPILAQMASTKASTPSFQRPTTPPGGRYGRRCRNRPRQAAAASSKTSNPSFGRRTTPPGGCYGRRHRSRPRQAAAASSKASNPSFGRRTAPPGGRYGRRCRNRPRQAAAASSKTSNPSFGRRTAPPGGCYGRRRRNRPRQAAAGG
ncbi:hypothetical protein B0H16DRAFT_238142 [Mycena metata]|uniref:Uncharacterized protein n=1 Tax=Mycena metata TaxID=1033252 RepID=A0AAD7JRK6_9AGAR|nr:hypothetical protein B0H16DRAFT_238142 [Mycena metata]